MDVRKFKSTIVMIIKGQAAKVYDRPICEKCVEKIYWEVLKALPLLALTKIIEHAYETNDPNIDLDLLKQNHD